MMNTEIEKAFNELDHEHAFCTTSPENCFKIGYTTAYKKASIEILEDIRKKVTIIFGINLCDYYKGQADRNEEIINLIDSKIEQLKAVNNG